MLKRKTTVYLGREDELQAQINHMKFSLIMGQRQEYKHGLEVWAQKELREALSNYFYFLSKIKSKGIPGERREEQCYW